jgi:Tol biopolymer transport system component
MRAALLLSAAVFAQPLLPQTVSAVDGNIVSVDESGRANQITSTHLDSEPSLSFDGRQVVFVRGTPNRTVDTGLGDIEETELWIARLDHQDVMRRAFLGHAGDFTPGPNMVMAGFSKPQFSPNGERVYFIAETWATSAAIHMLDLSTGKTSFLFPGLDVEVIRHGKYKGFLIGTKDPILEDRGRITVYWLLDPDGKQVERIGETEADLVRFRGSIASQ